MGVGCMAIPCSRMHGQRWLVVLQCLVVAYRIVSPSLSQMTTKIQMTTKPTAASVNVIPILCRINVWDLKRSTATGFMLVGKETTKLMTVHHLQRRALNYSRNGTLQAVFAA